MEQVLHFLQQFHPLSPALQDHLFSVMTLRELNKKEFLLKAGHVCRHIYFIEQGLLRSYYLKRNTEVCSAFMKEQDVIVSLESFHTRTASHEYIQALEDSRLWCISYEDLYYIYRTYPEFNWTGRELLQNYYRLTAKQLFGLRMQQATERYAWLQEHYPEFLLRIPAKYLASWIGMSEVMLSKVKGQRIS